MTAIQMIRERSNELVLRSEVMHEMGQIGEGSSAPKELDSVLEEVQFLHDVMKQLAAETVRHTT